MPACVTEREPSLARADSVASQSMHMSITLIPVPERKPCAGPGSRAGWRILGGPPSPIHDCWLQWLFCGRPITLGQGEGGSPLWGHPSPRASWPHLLSLIAQERREMNISLFSVYVLKLIQFQGIFLGGSSHVQNNSSRPAWCKCN